MAPGQPGGSGSLPPAGAAPLGCCGWQGRQHVVPSGWRCWGPGVHACVRQGRSIADSRSCTTELGALLPQHVHQGEELGTGTEYWAAGRKHGLRLPCVADAAARHCGVDGDGVGGLQSASRRHCSSLPWSGDGLKQRWRRFAAAILTADVWCRGTDALCWCAGTAPHGCLSSTRAAEHASCKHVCGVCRPQHIRYAATQTKPCIPWCWREGGRCRCARVCPSTRQT